ncbi:hypothetical protein FLL45_13135 [Aliikangiella marina]|uniref:SPOR domain-containing protein n=1 Tax=Aliikangiella marina TaxID=1712262 RepID=A0A545T9C8_9GAMM|nr:SPOR domain-containing protein [Aliikangiella marina]TQV73808.1 hypothetical protein FLL45_13135 [Aliikangiella marina]
MPRDYAKKSAPKKKKRGASRGKKQATVPLGLWLITVAAVLGLAGALIYIKWFNPKSQSSIVSPKPQQSSASKSTNSTNKSINNSGVDEVDEVPFYEVHKDLTNKKVEIPKEDLKLPDHYKKFFYTMPCGSFREPSRADELKAMIAMSGSSSEISQVQYQGTTWYRVQLGPFNSKRAAERIRHRLQDNGIHDCKINQHLKKD